MPTRNDRTGTWLKDGIILLVVMLLHGGAFLMLGNARQVGAIESKVASISMNLRVTPVIEEKIQGDIEGEPDPAQAMEPPPLVKADPELELQPQPDAEAAPPPEPELQPTPEPEPERLAQAQPQAEPAPVPQVRPQPKPQPKPQAAAEKRPPKTREQARKRKKARKKPHRAARKKQHRQRNGRRAGRLAKVNAPGRLMIHGSTKGTMRGPRQTSTGARVSLRRVREYGSLVRARIARYRPRGASRKCRVVITFSLSTSGSLRGARVARSCGTALDQAALRAVRRAAPFPRPPAGMTSAQLRFAIPFSFR